ncbi:MAG: AAA-like domain-containing protein [Deltaproteobacteria bacterium]|nr:AAA-like domain-containing protein [Deltaproteobacteria bacterium]
MSSLVENENYFVLHAPRQSGKTTSMMAFADQLRAAGRWAVVYATLETARNIAEEKLALPKVVDAIAKASRVYLPAEEHSPQWAEFAAEANMLGAFLTAWSARLRRPLVLLLDEIDSLEGAPLMAVLSQLRAGYLTRKVAPFPASVCLFGMRNIRDYKAASGGSPNIGTSSPFNVSRDAVTVAYFNRAEIAELYGQHMAETGQNFTELAIDRVWQLTRGQPFLVNALADFVVRKQKWTGLIDVAQVDLAKEQLILARVTHIDSLMARLREDRVRRVLAPILAGERQLDDSDEADLEYCRDLGLVGDVDGDLAIANDIYKEVIPRELAANPQAKLAALEATWKRADGSIDISVLFHEFAAFWRENGEWMLTRAHWPEAAHQIVFMAYLQKVVNGGGSIAREYGAGRKRVDLLVEWTAGPDKQRFAVELKVWRTGKADPLAEGLVQLDAYLQRMGLGEGTLAIFDLRVPARAWEDRGTVSEAETASGRKVAVWRL